MQNFNEWMNKKNLPLEPDKSNMEISKDLTKLPGNENVEQAINQMINSDDPIKEGAKILGVDPAQLQAIVQRFYQEVHIPPPQNKGIIAFIRWLINFVRNFDVKEFIRQSFAELKLKPNLLGWTVFLIIFAIPFGLTGITAIIAWKKLIRKKFGSKNECVYPSFNEWIISNS